MGADLEAGLRRGLDVACSTVGLLVLFPLMLALALAVRLDSAGPALFAQVRVGRRGHPFRLYKFRTMVCHQGGPEVTAGNDSRITRLGRHLRSTKLDELPQLVNILRGDMSLVGPRPEVPRYVQLWTHPQRDEVLAVRPGLTDPVTLTLRYEEQVLAAAPDPETLYVGELLPAKVSRYAEYVSQRTLMSDLAVLLRTGRVLVSHTRGASG